MKFEYVPSYLKFPIVVTTRQTNMITFKYDKSSIYLTLPNFKTPNAAMKFIENDDKVKENLLKIAEGINTSVVKILGKSYIATPGTEFKIVGDRAYFIADENGYISNQTIAHGILVLGHEQVVALYTKIYEALFNDNRKPFLQFTTATTYLGKYFPRSHKIFLSQKLLKLDIKEIIHTIIHEFTHIKYQNHQLEFYEELGRNIEKYERIYGTIFN